MMGLIIVAFPHRTSPRSHFAFMKGASLGFGEFKTKCKMLEKLEDMLDDVNTDWLKNCGCCSYADEDKIPSYYCPLYINSETSGKYKCFADDVTCD
jgi:hypothetical protein